MIDVLHAREWVAVHDHEILRVIFPVAATRPVGPWAQRMERKSR